MAYRIAITERAEELIDSCILYILNQLKNPTAANHLLDGIESIYDRLEDNPYQFPDSKDPFLSSRGYKEARVPEMDYKMVYRIMENTVYVVGFFHDLEDYSSKVIE